MEWFLALAVVRRSIGLGESEKSKEGSGKMDLRARIAVLLMLAASAKAAGGKTSMDMSYITCYSGRLHSALLASGTGIGTIA